MIKFVHETSLDDLKKIAKKIRLINTDKEKPTKEDIEKCSKYTDLEVSEQSTQDWYCLLRKIQGKIEVYRDENFDLMIDNKDFLGDSIFCEWAYLINMDSEHLEFYKGFNKNKIAPGRYTGKKEDDGYYGVSLIASIPLSEIQNTDPKVMLDNICKIAYPEDEQ